MWSTTNTRLAAALLVLKHQLQECAEFSHKDGTTTIHFDGESIVMSVYDRAWRERKHPVDGFNSMRKVAEAYDWLVNRVIYGQYEGVTDLPLRSFKTSSPQLASCLVALDYFLLKFDRDGYRFYFVEGAVGASNEFAGEVDCPAKWMRKYLERFEMLKKQIKQSRLDSVRSMRESCITR